MSNIKNNTMCFFWRTYKKCDNDIYCKYCKKSSIDIIGYNDNSIFNKEQLCLKCELNNYPQRFHGCGFCKRPIKKSFCCKICADGFIEWIKNWILPIDSQEKKFDDMIHDLLKNIKQNENSFIIRENDNLYKWSGFYAGFINRFSTDKKDCQPIWIIPKLTQRYAFTSANKKKLLQEFILSILKSNEIDLINDIQINSEIRINQIDTINYYDTRIIQL